MISFWFLLDYLGAFLVSSAHDFTLLIGEGSRLFLEVLIVTPQIRGLASRGQPQIVSLNDLFVALIPKKRSNCEYFVPCI